MSASRPKKMPVAFAECRETGIGAGGAALRLPGEAARRDAELGKPRLDRCERGNGELDAVEAPLVLEWLDALGRLPAEVDDLAVGPARQARVRRRQLARDHGDDRLADVFGELQLLLALDGGERVGRGEQHNRLTDGVRLAQRLAPALARADAVQVDEHVALGPAAGDEPAAKRQRGDVVRGGMAEEKTRHVRPRRAR
jgi:hypothetical protein